jgi:hypothetical protein
VDTVLLSEGLIDTNRLTKVRAKMPSKLQCHNLTILLSVE